MSPLLALTDAKYCRIKSQGNKDQDVYKHQKDQEKKKSSKEIIQGFSLAVSFRLESI
jgi:hypothetical protein